MNLFEQNGAQPERVVITGLGAVTPLGLTTATTWAALVAGQSGIDRITKFAAGDLRTTFAGEVRDFDPANYMDRKEARRLDPAIQYALAATQEAIADAALDLSAVEPARVGVIVGSAMGGVTATAEGADVAQSKGLRRVSPFMVPNMLIDSAAGKIAIEHNVHGINHAVVSACASGTAACGEAFEALRRGDADVMITGGTEATIVPVIVAGFEVMGALSQRHENPQAASRPFDKGRDGFVMSEGAAILILETERHARARGARIYAEVVGYGSSADAHHMVAPHESGRGAINAMKMALRKAQALGVQPQAIDYINAHGTSTQLNDRMETDAIKQVLGEHAYNVKVSGTKSMTGHLLGAAGALEALICVKVIEEGIIPPTINLDDPDPACDLDYTPHRAQRATVNVALSNSFGFGGHNAVILLRRYP
ncbi:MAG TPA: beta-ketoacyl-ACP synthase II [Caldilineaceae bacterium]|nr:beta-ketoacyl-ACP synthase II [Caldilineaceae bacterium]